MAESRTFNMDCIEAMKQMPDKCFDLAVVDPPYGGGCSQNVHVEREREREPTTPEAQGSGAFCWNSVNRESL